MQRRDVLARAAHTLADNQLRPGAEASRADAERAAAQTRAIQARQAATARADDRGARARRHIWNGGREPPTLLDAAPHASPSAVPAPSIRWRGASQADVDARRAP